MNGSSKEERQHRQGRVNELSEHQSQYIQGLHKKTECIQSAKQYGCHYIVSRQIIKRIHKNQRI